jgi:hypothetical protein
MDFLDPKKQRRQNHQLLIGYVLVGIAILIATVIMIELAFGYGYNNGKVVQNGLVFFSSQPNPAEVYLDGKLTKNTNTRLQLPEGTYNAKLQRSGYRPWQRVVNVEGGQVQHFDYPFLFPTTVVTKVTKSYPAAIPLSTQSPDRHWLLLTDTTQPNALIQYDLNNPKTAPSSIVITDTILTKPATTDSLKLVEWSTDNRHVLLQHIYDGGQEYIMVDRQTPANSINITTTLKLPATAVISLRNKAYDQYFVLDNATQALSTASINDPTFTSYIEHVLAYKSYGSDTVLYVTSEATPVGKATISLRQGDTTLTIRQITAAPPYLLDVTKYSGALYAVAGDSGDGKVYVFKNPSAHSSSSTISTITPTAVLRVEQANYVSFSDSAQYIMLQKANTFAVYDALTGKQYSYVTTQPIDAPQPNADWMDGDRIEYVSAGKLVVFDYDYTNVQTLVPANSTNPVFFDRNYKFVYTLAPSKTAPAEDLTNTSLLIPTDQ